MSLNDCYAAIDAKAAELAPTMPFSRYEIESSFRSAAFNLALYGYEHRLKHLPLVIEIFLKHALLTGSGTGVAAFGALHLLESPLLDKNPIRKDE
jgi:hypothetical protein